MNIGEYNPFTFMIVLLFIYTVLIGFIIVLIYNNINSSKSELANALSNMNNNMTSTTCSNCIPAPTSLKNLYS